MKKSASVLLLLLILSWIVAGCGGKETLQPVGALPNSGSEFVTVPPPVEKPAVVQLEEHYPIETPDSDDEEIRALLEKGASIQNISYVARFNSIASEFMYEFYKRGNLNKTVTRNGDSQSITVSDGHSKVYYSLPDNTGITLREAGDSLGLIPSTEALLDDVYVFRAVGEEQISGYLCQVVETEDENGALKIWISKALGLPIKYIGSDDNGWYSLELTDIQLGEPSESIFIIPSDIVMSY